MSFLPEFKTRKVETFAGATSQRSSGAAPWGAPVPIRNSVTESIMSQCHTGTWPPPISSESDIGGPMELHRLWDTHTGVSGISAAKVRGQTGIAQMNGYVLGLSPASTASSAVINAFGTKAIAAVLPTNPNASLATAIGELRQEGLPRLPGASLKDATSRAHKAGSEYLNVEFGWLPLVNDLQAFATSVRNSRQLIDQYIRDSDRKIRRRYTPQAIETTAAPFYGTGLCFGGFGFTGSVSRKETTQLWFSGAFKYHVPVGDDFYSRLLRYESLTNHLFGTRITPELVWNLAPWSWAVDWFTNVGDVIHNISLLGVDGLVMQYGYAMREMRVEEIVSGTYSFSDSFGSHSGSVERRVGSQWKQRIRANPYGFGIDDTSLTAAQLAILAALGLTKGKRNT